MPTKIIIFGDPKRRYATEAMERFLSFTEGKVQILSNSFDKTCPLETLKQADFAVVFGGDGTILSAARDLCEADVPVIGVNVGRLGFLAEFSIEELKQLFDQVTSTPDLIEQRMILACSIERNGEEIFSSTAVNDVVIAAGEPFNMIDMQISVKGDRVASCFGDGLIVCTPTGSTAYNLSAGGPILSANLSAIVITPLCPHSLSFRPIVIRAESVIRITTQKVNDGTTINLDGQLSHKLLADDIVTIRKHHGAFLVVNNPIRTQWDTLAGKLNWAEKPKYNTSADN